MTDGNQESEKLVSSSKLSATVPAFVPRIANTGPMSSSDLVINSKLSPLVPEFKPAPFTSYALPVYKPVHPLHYQNHRPQSTEYKQAAPHQAQPKKSTDKSPKTVTTRKREESSEGQTTQENVTGENLPDDPVNTKKKRRNRKKKEPSDSTQQRGQEEFNSEGLTEGQQELTVIKNTSDETKHKHASSNANEQFPSLQQNSPSIHLSISSTEDTKTDINSTANCKSSSITDEMCNKNQNNSTNFTVSYSDKVKSVASKNISTTSSHVGTEKSWVKDFAQNNSSRKSKHHNSSEVLDSQSASTDNLHASRSSKEDIKGGSKRVYQKKRPETTWNAWEDSGYYKLKNGETLKSQTRNAEQIPRTGRQIGKNNSGKKMTCDDDDNWRLKRDDTDVVRHSTVSSKTETCKNSSIKNINPESVQKRTCQEIKDVDSKKYDRGGVKNEKSVSLTTSSKKQQILSGLGSGSSSNETNTRLHSSNMNRHFQSGPQGTPEVTETLSVAPSNGIVLEGEFPDLSESVKIKRPITADKTATDHKEMISSPKPSAPLSYSAALRSAPKPKPVPVSPTQHSGHPTKQGPGLLKMPPQVTVHGEENDTDAKGEKQKKKKKKKKKKKSTEGGDQAQQNASPKRTEKPIQFDLGIMLQTISSPETKQSGKKHVIATGVLPSQVSVAEEKSPVKNAWLPKKEENKVPHNMLDSTAPVVKRGKERETPARKKPSALKKIILKEREEKKKARETGELSETDKNNEICEGNENRTNNEEVKNMAHEEDMQNPSEEETSSAEPSSPTDREIAAEIHSRRFREYCFQVPDKEVDTVATELLRELVRFQDRQFHKDPVKAKAKRRFVLGLREVSKHLKLRKVKCVIISSNVERIKSAGGLDDTLGSIIMYCNENQIPVVFALKRQLLGKVLLKKVPVSIVGIFNYDGAQDHFRKLIELTQKTKQAYSEKWQETREKLESQQKESTADTKMLSADEEEGTKLPCSVTGEDAVKSHHEEEATEVSEEEDDDDNEDDDNDDDEDEDDDGEEEEGNSNDIDESGCGVIVEHDLDVQDL